MNSILDSLHQPNAAEMDAILEAKCQPAHVEYTEPERTPLDKLRELRDMQASSCDCINDSYFRGLYNGLELALAVMEDREPDYIGKPQDNTTQAVVSSAKPAIAGLQRFNDGTDALHGSAFLRG